ncbi:MAG: hypothetical protein IT214_11610 [Chitinophagaceae bacterium]|nr:hypothetical protein [Chitinophagaceae bacterium]
MRKYLSDRNLVIILFVLVLITFSFAHEDSKALQEFSTKGSVSADNGLNVPVKIVRLSPAIDPGKK